MIAGLEIWFLEEQEMPFLQDRKENIYVHFIVKSCSETWLMKA